jgi:hypothetical protein
MDITRLRKPRCFLLYALAPPDLPAGAANEVINRICGDRRLPLALYHDHFIGQSGGIVLFYAETAEERDALQTGLESHLAGWTFTLHPLIYSYSPAAFDAQIDFTLRAYRDKHWDMLRDEQRPSYGDPGVEARSGEED